MWPVGKNEWPVRKNNMTKNIILKDSGTSRCDITSESETCDVCTVALYQEHFARKLVSLIMKISRALFFCLVATVSLPASAFSQEVGKEGVKNPQEMNHDKDSIVLQTITVTSDRDSSWESAEGYVTTRSEAATMTDTLLINTPASVSVVTRDEMDAQGAQTVSQALRYVPGVLSESRASARYDSVFVRGFGGFGQTTNFVQYLDGLKLPRGLSYLVPSIDPYLLERIDIVRGPNSVLYGQVNPGGLVNQITRHARFENVNEAFVTFGTNTHKSTGFDFGRVLDEDNTLSGRVTGVIRDGESQSGLDERRFAIAPSLTWRPDAATTLNISAWLQHDPEGGDYNAIPGLGTLLPHKLGKIPYDAFIGEPDFEKFKRDVYSFAYLLSHDFSEDLSFRQNVRYTYGKSEYRNVSGALLSDSSPMILRQATAADETMHGFSADQQLRWGFNTGTARHTVLGGFEYQYGVADRLIGTGSPGLPLNFLNPVYGIDIPTPAFSTDSRRKQSQFGFYLQDQIEWGNWVAQMGIRHDRVKTEDQVKTFATGARSQTDQNDNATTYKIGLLHHFDNGFAPYISYSTSFEPTTSVNLYGHPFVPSTATQWEVGLKYEPEAFDGLFTLAYFDLTRENVLTKDLRPGAPSNAQIQTGEIRVKGIEFEARTQWTQNFSTIATATHLMPEVTASNTPNEEGNAPVGVPETMASLWAEHKFLDGSLSLAAGVRYMSSTWADVANTIEVPAVTLVDAAIRYDLGNLDQALDGVTLSVNGSNLLNKKYLSSCTASSTGLGCFAGPGREVAFTLGRKW